MSNLYSLYRNYSFGKNSCGINFNSPIPTTLQDPGPYTTRCTLRTEDKTRSGWDDDDSHRCSAKCKSRFGIFAIFVERRQPRARQNKVEERERGGLRQADAISRNKRCTHIVATLPRYCFTLQNIAFYLRAASSHGSKTRRWSTSAVASYSSCVQETWIRTDDYKSDINLLSSLSSSPLSKFSFFLCFFRVKLGGGRVLKVRFRFWAAARCRGKSR